MQPKRFQLFLVHAIVSLAWANAPLLRADLVSHFTFDGNLLDTGPAGNNGTFAGGAAPVFVDGRDGTPGGAISLDGVDDYVLLARTAGLPLSTQPAFTIAMWVKSPLPTATVRDRRFFSEGSTTSNNPLFNLGTDTAGVAGVADFFYRNDANGTVVNHRKSAAVAFDNNWHHVAWVDSNGTVVLYIDGLPDAISFNYARAVLTTNTTTIGGILRAAASAFFPGAVDDVRLYNHALTLAELEDIIEAPGCPAEGDTTCTGLTVVGPPGNAIGTYNASATAADVSGDPVLRYTFSATNADNGQKLVRGPGPATTADFVLGVGHWTVAVTIDDELFCFDSSPAATCSTEIVISPPPMLVSRWTFDSTLEDSEPAGNDGTFVGGPAPVYSEGYDGTAAGAITFDGVDDYVAVLQQSGLPIYASPAHTIALWVKGMPQGDRRLYSEGSTTSNTPLLNVGTDQSGLTGKADILIRSDANVSVVNHRQSGRDILDGAWHHLAWVDAGGAAVLYIDGLREPTNFEYPRSLLTLNTTSIGAVLRAAPCCFFAGEIDEARVYNYALTLAEIEALVPEPPGCPGDADTHCAGLEVTGPTDRASGTYVAAATAADTSGDTALFYTFTAREAGGAYLQAGPSPLANASFQLSAGTWTISVLADDHLRCRDVAEDASCTEVVEVLTEPAILLSRLPFDGNTLDAEPAGNDGTFLGEPQTPFLRGYDCTNAGAVRFDGTNDFLELEQATRLPIHKRPAYSVAMWVKGPAGQIDRRVFSESSRANRTPLFNIGTDSTGATGTVDLFLRGDTQTPLGHVRSTGTAFDGEWHHLAWVDQSGDARLYIDGVEDATNFDYVPGTITLDATTVGGIVRTSATTGLDDPCCFFSGVIDDVQLFTYALSVEEVLALHGTGPGDCCPDSGDTRCSGLEVAGPEGMGPGDYTLAAAASDDSGDAILYSFRAQLGAEVRTAGPQTGNMAVLALTEGTWTVSVTVDDDLECPDVAPEATCTREVLVCPAAGDTHCGGLTVAGPEGNVPGLYELSAAATDDSGDSILYTFRADSLSWDPLSIGPQPESTAAFTLLEGDWTLSVTVDDGEACLDTAEDAGCSQEVTVNPGGAGPFLRGDSNDDAKLDIADPVFTLNWLFLESRPAPPCAAAADSNADGRINISDPSHSLNHLFVGGPAPLPPFPECGRSTVESDRLLGCAAPAGCSA